MSHQSLSGGSSSGEARVTSVLSIRKLIRNMMSICASLPTNGNQGSFEMSPEYRSAVRAARSYSGDLEHLTISDFKLT